MLIPSLFAFCRRCEHLGGAESIQVDLDVEVWKETEEAILGVVPLSYETRALVIHHDKFREFSGINDDELKIMGNHGDFELRQENNPVGVIRVSTELSEFGVQILSDFQSNLYRRR
jgi:hypothetical protein